MECNAPWESEPQSSTQREWPSTGHSGRFGWPITVMVRSGRGAVAGNYLSNLSSGGGPPPARSALRSTNG